MKAKQWLKANGFPDISLGKGRLSNEQRAAVEAAVARGVRIDGYSVAQSTSTAPKVERVAPVVNTVADIGEPTFPEVFTEGGQKYARVAYAGDTKIGMRHVCDNCRCSITYCRDGSPKVMVDGDTPIVVSFKTKKVPADYRPNKWW